MRAKLFAVDSVQTLDEFELRTLGVADALSARGLSPGDRVMLKAGNSVGYVSALFALMHLGASIVLVDPQETANQTGEIIERAGVRMSIVDDDAPLTQDQSPVYVYELLADAASAPPGRRLCFDRWCALPDSIIMWSSGSTGAPKGIVKNGARFLKNMQRNADQVGHRADDVLLPLLPFSHQYGISMVMIAWLTRCSLIIAPYRRLDHALRMAGQCGATVVDAAPSTYQSMLNIVGKRPEARAALMKTRMLCSGAAPLDSPLVAEYESEFGMTLLDSYGSTELGNLAFATLENPVGTGQVMDGIGCRIVDENDRDLAATEIGEVLIDCPDMLTGLLGEDAMVTPAEQGWHRTGDLGYLDENRNLFILGRKSAVHRMGYTIHPEVIERKVAAQGCTARIISLPEKRQGVQLVFFVADPQRRESGYWRSVLTEALPPHEQPNRVVVVDRFPVNRNGKPDKNRMEELARAESGVAA
ncbi:class I adenylate-forming enzyme family protein [Sciscionella marina]|uniref:class I adenylate-forming enzyme family protein n=1 Tax=Sciscionella marina TaxID=508770 RepID=UPI00058C757D|nr:class I adenylate-forming enzyme family protein [Sciscionella marina]